MSNNLSLILAGPIVRRATKSKVWFWFSSSKKITHCKVIISSYLNDGKKKYEYSKGFGNLQTVRLGKNIWINLVSAKPNANPYPYLVFPTDTFLGYDLELTYNDGRSNQLRKISGLGLKIEYSPFPLPTFVIGQKNTKICHGSCRRPGAPGEDAFLILDKWVANNINNPNERPASLLLTGDQIYADQVAAPLFKGLHKLALDLFGYVEKIPIQWRNPIAKGLGITELRTGYESVDNFIWGSKQSKIKSRYNFTRRTISPIGFTTEFGEFHLFSFAEYSAMYLIVWNPELCKYYNIDDGSNQHLKDFCRAVEACRRIMANMVTYMIFDDHEITDDWNLDKRWEKETKRQRMARKIISNGLAAYWGFQHWGNNPDEFNKKFIKILQDYFNQLMNKNGWPITKSKIASYINHEDRFEKLLIYKHWSFMAPTNPPALFVDTRTLRETPWGKTAILSGKRVWPKLLKILSRSQFTKKGPFLLILPSPFLQHRAMIAGKNFKYDSMKDRYEADFEGYFDNSEQRADFILWIKKHIDPSALIIFSGDVHHGFVVSGRYASGKNLDDIKNGKADWVIRVVQITSSPIKNVIKSEYVDPTWLGTDLGNIGESIVTLWETQFKTTPNGDKILMHAVARKMKGPLGRQTYIFENHFCVVNVPIVPKGRVYVRFIGQKKGKLADAKVDVDIDNSVSKLKFERIGTRTSKPPQD